MRTLRFLGDWRLRTQVEACGGEITAAFLRDECDCGVVLMIPSHVNPLGWLWPGESEKQAPTTCEHPNHWPSWSEYIVEAIAQLHDDATRFNIAPETNIETLLAGRIDAWCPPRTPQENPP